VDLEETNRRVESYERSLKRQREPAGPWTEVKKSEKLEDSASDKKLDGSSDD